MAESEGEFIEWSDERYSTDIDRFDEQHKHLFGLLNDLHVAIEAGHSEAVVGDILEELERYTEYHFGDEEEFMQDCGYAMDCADCFYQHREFHEEFVETVGEFRERHENGEPITTDVLEFTKEWLDAHIAGPDVDQKYSHYYRQEVPEDYDYQPGKLNSEREGERTYAADDDGEVTLASDVRAGGAVSIPRGSMAEWFGRLVDRHGDRPVAYAPNGDGYATRTFRDLYDQAWAVASGLLEAGVSPGSTLGLCARSGYAWSVVDLACHLAGVVSVPIDPADTRAVAVETTTGVDTLVADDSASAALREAAGTVFELDALPTGDRDHLPGFDADPHDVATVVAPVDEETGTLGCAVTHRNLLAAVAMLGEQFPVTRGSTGTCPGPLSRLFPRVATYYLWDRGATAAYLPGEDLRAELSALEPDVLVGRAEFYEGLAAALRAAIDDMGGLKRRLADGAAVDRGRALREGATGSLTDSAAARVVFGPLRESFGIADLDFAIAGPDPVGAELVEFLWGVGIPVSQVYGAPELTGVGCVTPYGSGAPEALGTPLPGTEVAVTEADELAVRGAHVVEAYWETSDVAASTSAGEWYTTGVRGRFDDEGRLREHDEAPLEQ
ncbi:bacteriohemerythrin [Haloarcula onubensis]|uniref:Bacteriohemerythrin n=1 Tax=Haloarcula onubensis TaxID=2950539 RepID=A0ABU2FN71_9EURY|nr:bacteriohemerythrin [Halomicroarcula sp. S3CR25-11]MDS0282188.1 bacteriohemerythrin [Halomicroarcula sp. S3CR25-11]